MSPPKLSEQLLWTRAPDRCQSCNAHFVDFERWREHDDDDQPTAVVVVLCKPCGRRLIKPHPRLYGEMDPREPDPGTMELCILCRHRDGVRCPVAARHGGPGVEILPPPQMVHLTMSPRSRSGLYPMYPSMPMSCDRRWVLGLVDGKERVVRQTAIAETAMDIEEEIHT